MLDATDLIANTTTVYRANDPAQALYRGLLASYSDDELTRLEDAIGAFSLTGLLPERLRALLEAKNGVVAAA